MATLSTEIEYRVYSSCENLFLSTVDKSTYGGTDLSWSSADSRGLIKIVDPFGNINYENTDVSNPDITSGGSFYSGKYLSTDGDGNVIQGTYTITLTLFDVNADTVLFYREYSTEVTFKDPTVDLDVSYSVINPIYFKSVDNTVYDQYNYTYRLERTQKLFNPSVIGGYQQGTDATFTTNLFYTGTSTMQLTTTTFYEINGFYTDADSVNVTSQLICAHTTNQNVVVDDSNSVCAQYCCVKGVWDKWQTAKTNLSSDAAKWQEKTLAASTNWFMLKQAFECNQSQDVAGYVAQIKSITSCSGSDCGCSDVTPTQVIGIGTLAERVEKFIYTATSDITSYTLTDLIGLDWSNGDFMVFVDGSEVESSSGTATFNTATGEFTFGFTVYTGTDYYFQIIKR